MTHIPLVAIDIETYADETKISSLPEPEVSIGNLKDPDKIAAKIAEAKQKQIESMALNPLTAKIASIAYSYGGEDTICHISDEVSMLNRFFELIKGRRIITFNGINFDIPFIYKRALILGVRVNVPLDDLVKRYQTIMCVDLMQVWSGWNSQSYVSLDTLARVLLGKRKIDFDFREIPELLKTSEGREKLSEYNKKDAELTVALFEKMDGVLFKSLD